MKLPKIPGGDLDVGRLVFQLLFTLACATFTIWALPRMEQDFRDLGSGNIRLAQVDRYTRFAFKTFGVQGGIIASRIFLVGVTLLTLTGVKEAIDEMKAEYAAKQKRKKDDLPQLAQNEEDRSPKHE